MFNLFKVTNLLQSMPSFATEHNLRLAPQEGQEPLAYSPKRDRRASPVSKGEQTGKQTKGKGNKRDNDDNDNNNGGFL
jgi:hypothetical protein